MSRGLFTVIVALYGVEDYVETFLRSLERQSYPFADLDVVIVDDGTPDRSYEIVKKWAEKYPGSIRHTTKPNGGPASARNVGLDMARNEWVTFCDPDDALQSDYFERVELFLRRDAQSRASMLTTRVMIWQEETSKVTDTHPLAGKFQYGEKLVDLSEAPNYIQLGGASTFLRNSVLREHNLRFDERIRPTFEDAELIGRYLGHVSEPVVGVIPSARYLYRKRGDGSSLVQSSWGRLERYDEVLRYGYLNLLSGLKVRLGYVPRWAQNMVLYDLQWYLTEDKKMHSSSAWLPDENAAVFRDLLRSIFSYIDTEAIRDYNLSSMSWIIRTAMLVRFKGQGVRLQPVINWSGNKAQSIKVGYGYSGGLPVEDFEIGGSKVVPTNAKSVAHSFYGQIFFYERMVWLPGGGQPIVRLNGVRAKFHTPRPPGWDRRRELSTSSDLLPAISRQSMGTRLASSYPSIAKYVSGLYPLADRGEMLASKVQNRLRIERLVSGATAPQAATNIAVRVVRRKLESRTKAKNMARDKQVSAWAVNPSNKQKFRDAWLVMDRVNAADDNGEHFYRYLMEHQPHVNAWFLLDQASQDWKRLSNAGFRLVDIHSDEAVALTLNAVFKISSDATYDVQYPVSPKRFGTGKGKIVFLQHGVTKDDLSRWLNPKPISMICTATRKEYQSISGDLSPYRFTPKETKLTGFPRFDELLRKADANPIEKRPYILVMPTWRQELKTAMDSCRTDRERLAVFEESDYGRSWLGFLSSPVLREESSKAGLEIIYVLHPSIAQLADSMSLPPYIRSVRASDVSLQDILVRSRLAITDYSSIAFDVALAGGAVVYFQFDADVIFNGRHNYRKGYYNYEVDGFGPVAENVADLEAAIKKCSDNEFRVLPEYVDRVKETFAFADIGNCERVFYAITSL